VLLVATLDPVVQKSFRHIPGSKGTQFHKSVSCSPYEKRKKALHRTPFLFGGGRVFFKGALAAMDVAPYAGTTVVCKWTDGTERTDDFVLLLLLWSRQLCPAAPTFVVGNVVIVGVGVCRRR
jgi:hypothetical protein